MGHACAVRTATFLLLAVVAGCSAPSAKAPSSAKDAEGAASAEDAAPAYGQPAVTSNADPEDEFARAEAELERLFGDADGARATQQQAEPLAGGDRCELACRALGSMRRASERVCGLEPDGERCDGVQERTRRAADRVRAACPSCAEL